MLYTVGMMDKLEQWKTEHANDQEIHDDMAAQAYMEQFAFDTFERADKAMRGRKTTVQTADTFQAARTFLDLLSIWNKPPETEVVSKSKYAKYHAVRILKAIKAGEDPNLEEEQQEPPPVSPPPLDPNDPEVRKINALQPSVEDAEDDASTFNQTGPSNTLPFPQSRGAPSVHSPIAQNRSIDGYFAEASPTVPTFTADDTIPSLPTAAAGSPMDLSKPPSDIISPLSPSDYYTQQQPPILPPSVQQPPTAPLNHPDVRAAPHFSPQPQQPFSPPQIIPTPQSERPRSQFSAAPPTGPEVYKNDDEAIIHAVKHGKWALSALNFDDVETAVKEFRIALQHLGAQ